MKKLFNLFMPSNEMVQQSNSQSLEKNILIKVAVLFIVSTLIMALISGLLMFRYHVQTIEKQLITENILKAEKESVRFQNAVVQLNLLKKQIIEELKTKEVKKDFYTYMESHSDGSYRTYLNKSENGKKTVGFISSNSNISNDPDFIKKYMITYDLIDTVGAINKENYFMTWAVFPNDSNIVFCPQKPKANYELIDNFSDTQENYWKMTTQEFNPSKEGKWLEPYYDPGFKVWMISYVVPVYVNNSHIMSIGFDIKIDEFFNKIIKISNSDSEEDNHPMFNFIMTNEGVLIAHPHYMEKIKSASSEKLTIFSLPEKDIYSQLLIKDYLQTSDFKYTTAAIDNTNWILVSVYNNMNFVYLLRHTMVILGFITVFLVILIVGTQMFLRKKLTYPLIQLADSMIENIMNSKYNKLNLGEIQELNKVINSYNGLLDAYEKQNKHINSYNDRLQEDLKKELSRGLQLVKSNVMHDLMRNINSDIYTPLTILNMTLEALKKSIDENKPELAKENINKGTLLIKKMAKLVSKLDILSKSTNPEQVERINVGSLIKTLQNIYNPVCEENKIKIEWVSEDHKHFECKENSTLHSMMILIDNAIESVVKTENPWVKVQFNDLGDTFLFRVSDSGKPIKEEIINRALSSKSEGGYSTKKDHRGYGLHTCLGIMKECEGKIQYQELDGHPTFELIYPSKKAIINSLLQKKVS